MKQAADSAKRRHVLPKRRFTFNGLHGGISQKIELFITTAVRSSNPTFQGITCTVTSDRQQVWGQFIGHILFPYSLPVPSAELGPATQISFMYVLNEIWGYHGGYDPYFGPLNYNTV
jgi:hypothetical protein